MSRPAEVRSLDAQRIRSERGRDEQVLIEADRIRDGLSKPNNSSRR